MTNTSNCRAMLRSVMRRLGPWPTSSTTPSGVIWKVQATMAAMGKPMATATVAAAIVQFGTGRAPESTSTICNNSQADTA